MRELDHSIESAPSGVPRNWHAIDWQRVERNVRGMQVRIAKATREGDWRRVKALQRMLTRSLCGKWLAVRRVALYRSQHGQCLVCMGPITRESGWHDHHLQYRVLGGSDALVNRVLLHPFCHTRLHELGLVVIKPAP